MLMKIDDIKKLHQKKYRAESGLFLVEGEHLVLELEKAAQNNATLRASELFVTENHKDFPSQLRKHVISEKNMALITDTTTPQGIVAVAPLHFSHAASRHNEKAIYLHEVQDPGNLGSILRTLAWFGRFRCLLSPGSVDPFNPKVVRASMGAIFHVPIELDVSLEWLHKRYKHIAVLDMYGMPIRDAAFATHDCYLFGNEARGVPHASLQGMAATPFTITGSGTIESLNLATAVNMCAYELNR